jgi:hypothetical protein
MATSTNDLIVSTRRILLSGQNERRNKMLAPAVPGAGSLTLAYDVSQIAVGSTVQVDLELFYVWATDANSKTLTVSGAQDGTDAASHDAGAIVTINPKFPDQMILDALNDDLADLSSPINGLFAVRVVDLPFTGGRGGYDLAGASNLLEVMQVRYSSGGLPGDYPILSGATVGRGLPTTDYPSGNALFLSDGGNGRTLVVTYKAAFSPITATTADVAATSGLPSTALDLPPMGATVRLAYGGEIRRNFSDAQGDSRRAAEVPAGAVGAAWRGIEQKRQQRIVSEAARLAQMYPDAGFVPAGYGGAW